MPANKTVYCITFTSILYIIVNHDVNKNCIIIRNPLWKLKEFQSGTLAGKSFKLNLDGSFTCSHFIALHFGSGPLGCSPRGNGSPRNGAPEDGVT